MQRSEGRQPGIDRFLDVWHARQDCRTHGPWSKPQRVFSGYVGALLGATQLRSGRILLPFAYWVGGRPTAPPTGANVTTVLYSDDGGANWHATNTELTTPCYADYNGNNYGGIEPDVVELADGRIWLMMRTQTGLLYESFSREGIQWTPATPSRFRSGNGPVAFLRLPDGRLVMFWNNADLPSRVDGQGVYGARDELQAAISPDDGDTWRGFRTVYRDPKRDLTPPRRGDRGTAYPDAEVASDGSIVVTAGHGEPSGVVRFSPDWLSQTVARDDFSGGLDSWSVFKHFGPASGWWRDRVAGAELIDHPSLAENKVLQLRRPDDKPGDGAIWNFPLGWKGRLKLRLMLRTGFGGGNISLNDRFFNPTDEAGEANAMFRLQIPANGTLTADSRLELDRWHDVTLQWNLDARTCSFSVDGKPAGTLSQHGRTLNGVCYLRLRSTAESLDPAGFLVDSVSVEIDDPVAPSSSAAAKQSP